MAYLVDENGEYLLDEEGFILTDDNGDEATSETKTWIVGNTDLVWIVPFRP